ncbi:MAG: SEC-C domain-containing protein, partial [Oscillospiraceae bacterium]|nr:SEC-C domain-containing protein [Oscillospiraceae bacterium]
GQVMIVDEFTGRIMIGRRFNEGLHQALEAKENVEVLRESKTLATITFQNYFRMYKKLSGMTGTAMTEEDEFATIYSLDIVEVPTNRPNVRIDHDDVIYKNEKAKFNAVIERIVECHQKGQPVLVGTISIEKSEMLGKMLSRRGVKHEVLNAKFHDKEAEIIAQAGKLGAVTIATNMAGRGTDIILGGNAEYMAKNEMRRMGYYENLLAEVTGFNETKDKELIEARETFKTLEAKYKNLIKDEAEKVKAVGGLYISGTERHESRRIDNQLRGRAARQGDPGETIFFLSLEDDLMRLFGGERIQNLMETMNVDENTPIEMKMLTNSIEQAQKRVEGRNFGIRKNVLRYDDVMNKQREIIYGQRGQVLDGHDISATIASMLVDTIKSTVGVYVNAAADPVEWNLKGLRNHYLGWITEESDLRYSEEELANLTKEDVENFLVQKAQALYAAREGKYGDVVMREMERVALLRVVDTKWMAHIDDMDQLKRGIGLRSYAQKDPVVEYQIEGFDMFDEMIEAIKEDTLRLMLTFVLQGDEPKRTEVAKATGTSHGDGSVKKQPKKVQKVGRNDPCPCGSGKKYKKCCGRNE